MRIEGLIPAIVQDFNTGRVLMLAYVNQDSYDFMQERGETCFWSRSRNELWHKGATSGNIQKIRAMSFDCDDDALLIQVEQTGKGACHTGSMSCFGEESGAFYVLNQICERIEERKASPQEKSYTNYLLEQGVDKICKKIGEEATETIIAAKNGDSTPLIGELSDLAYHLLVLMSVQGVSTEDVQNELAERHQVQSNLKTPKKI
ncbi:MAG: bifunctional phosphoribosyl-AMP cyclohydrolase/phosphoribosyl-ATP diphosphatase HisIE [Oscillospiraceae bacterium]|nr:bifunctional phosphoribosyl-AMP cyclohydrolase/phosphoribosyl-ATP diphosphatase HisIE [Oscillospiraceae bacterium]